MNDTSLINKRCTKCGEFKSLSDFYSNSSVKSGLRPECIECHKKYSKQYRENNKEQETDRAKKYREHNPEKVKALFKRYREQNKDKRSGWNKKRRALKLGNSHIPYTLEDIFKEYGFNCFICGKAIDLSAPRQPGKNGWELGLHIDHLISLKNGGADSLQNVRPTHGKCNLKKGSRNV
jgi:5-methylcytosine-specific restriction endonuclease McrA